MWFYQELEFTEELVEDYYGFVYCIENLTSGQKYIGRKYFTKAATKQVKGKKKKIRKSSGWENYWGSSIRVLDDIKLLGKENFKRTILRLCKTRGETNYWEAKYQFEFDVLNGTDYYNDNIMMKFTRRNIGE